MIERLKQAAITELLDQFPAVAILGPRQVGKTTMAQEIADGRASQYLDLERETDRVRLTDPGDYLRRHEGKLIVLDEIHRMPDIFTELRGVIDDNRRAGRRVGQFLILGSASIELLRQSGESLAGRIAYCELGPLNAMEVPENKLDQLWMRGGFPDSFLARNDQTSRTWRRDFIRTYLERDVASFGSRIPAERLGRFWTMLAHLHGGLLNAAQLARNLEVDNKTISTYLDLLVDLLLVRRLRPWHGNLGKRLVKSPKVYLRDSGLLHQLLQIGDLDVLLGHPKLGESWEGFVIENLLSLMPEGQGAHFYRSAAGAEIDLLLDMPGGLWAIEVKRNSVPKLSRGFHNACADLNPARRIVVHSGPESFKLDQGIDAMKLSDLMGEISDIRW